MSLLVLLLAGWLVTMVLAAWFASRVSRAAAMGEKLELQDAEAHWVDRRTGPADRRPSARPWQDASPGRRRGDLLRVELAETRKHLAALEAHLHEAESRQRRGAG